MIRILEGHCLDRLRELPDDSVHCIVTSPPYWALRDYKTEPVAWPEVTFCPMAGLPPITIPASVDNLGLEADPWAYVGHMVAVFRECRRVLRKDGTCWVNLGDSYAGSGCGGDTGKSGLQGSTESQDESKRAPRAAPQSGLKRLSDIYSPRVNPRANHKYQDNACGVKPQGAAGLKSKDLCGIPWRVAFALQADGWWLRQDIIWHKPNPMPESIDDRCTKAHEYFFLLAKTRHYHYDAEAIKEESSPDTHPRRAEKTPDGWDTSPEGSHGSIHKNGREKGRTAKSYRPSGWAPSDDGSKQGRYERKLAEAGSGIKSNTSFSAAMVEMPSTRNKRSVWTITTQGYKDAHFATFPEDLIKPPILAGCPALCCATCGAPHETTYEVLGPDLAHQQACGGDRNGEYHGEATKDFLAHKAQDASATKARILAGMVKKRATGTRPTCDCAAGTVTGTVLDPFGGSGTTAKVAAELGRKAIVIELKPDYVQMIEKRTSNLTPGLNL